MSTDHEFNREFGFMLHDVGRLLRRNFDRRVKELGLTQSQWKVLVHVSRREGLLQRELACSMEVQPMSVAKQVAKMEEAGWLERVPDTRDRRAIQVHLTDKSKAILSQMCAFSELVFKEAFQEISEEELANLMRCLSKMRTNLLDQSI